MRRCKSSTGLLDEELDLVEPDEPVELPVAGDLVVDAVSFRYAPELDPVLRDVSLTLETGQPTRARRADRRRASRRWPS